MYKEANIIRKSEGGELVNGSEGIKKTSLLAMFGLLLLSFFIYFNSLQFDLLKSWDDNHYIINNLDIKHLNWENIKLIFSSFYVGNYQPLTMLFYSFEYWIGGGEPFIFHLTNVLIHLMNTFLVFVFIKKLDSSNDLVALITAAFFALHPMHVESVAWVSEQKDVLYSFFLLLSLISYLYYVQSHKTLFIILSLFLFISSCLSKSAAVILPLLLLLIDFYQARERSLKMILEKIPFFIISMVFGLVAMQSQRTSIQEMAPPMTWLEHVSVVSHSFMSYLVKAIVPINLSAVYTYPEQLGKTLPLNYYLSIIAIAVIIFMVVYSARKTRVVLFGFLFFLITIVLVLQIIPIGAAVMADRYTYIPYIGLFFLMGKLVFYLMKLNRVNVGLKYLMFALLGILFILFAKLTYARIAIWENDETLFTDVIRQFPNSYISYHDRGVYYLQLVSGNEYAGSMENKEMTVRKGIADFENAVKCAIKTDQKVSSYNNLGYAHYILGEFNESISNFDQAIRLDNKCASAYLNRGFAKTALKQFESAILDFDQTIALNPGDSSAIQNRRMVKSFMEQASSK